ncbi:MAG: hypothetical protein RLZ98_502 [Pseudomonadota bacterium]|jgi:SH3-like domain-containing protein
MFRVFAGLLAGVTLAAGVAHAQGGVRTGPSGQPLPRYVSLKSDRVNMRKGPGTQYPIAWVYRRAGLPVEVINEYENWREVRDAEGATGWVFRPLLSNRRTAVLLAWKVEKGKPPPTVELKASSSHRAATVVTVEAGVIANIRSCDGAWCLVTIGSYQGHLQQDMLWGVYKKERIR